MRMTTRALRERIGSVRPRLTLMCVISIVNNVTSEGIMAPKCICLT